MILYLRYVAILLSVCVNSLVFAEGILHNDPFTRPLINTSSLSNAQGMAETVEEAPWNPQLSAVMVAGKNSLVTVDGVTLKLGEEKDGYRLIQVKDHQAIFKKGSKRVVLEMPIMTMRQNKERGVE